MSLGQRYAFLRYNTFCLVFSKCFNKFCVTVCFLHNSDFVIVWWHSRDHQIRSSIFCAKSSASRILSYRLQTCFSTYFLVAISGVDSREIWKFCYVIQHSKRNMYSDIVYVIFRFIFWYYVSSICWMMTLMRRWHWGHAGRKKTYRSAS